jgi:cytochrome P450
VRVDEEIANICPHLEAVTLEDVRRLDYCNAYMKEILRYDNPVSVGMPKLALKDTLLGDQFHIRKGEYVLGSLHAVHHNPMYFD